MFSVVIPLYNKELSINETVQSVLCQSYQLFEVIIVNDGSTDNSVSVVEGIEDDRVRIVHQDNQGVSTARNIGIKEAKYDWIAFLDADDVWEQYHLEEISKMIKKFPDEKVFTTTFKYSDEKPIINHSHKKSIYKVEDYFDIALKESIICSSNAVINRSCLEKVGMFDSRIHYGEDLDLWARLACDFHIVKSKLVTATYRIDAENRAGLAKNVKASVAYHIDLRNAKTKEEREYLLKLVLERMVAYIRRYKIKNFLILKKRHPEISYKNVVAFAVFRIIDKIIKNK
ncbi:glycosyltransferase family 2 protein [uncultured Halomonas sp.]|uniref:glycosyltransferase family 2 protein n=1 Tax=uncultured Halomonas sp. TaxID=173971 RepID=UPI00261D53CB|nr:glycosyltransferase family 2 protein [uncultured Halomonas sp.]